MIIEKEDGTKVIVTTTNGLSTVSVPNEVARKEAKKVSDFFRKWLDKVKK